MRRYVTHQRLVAGITTLALVVTQVPATAIAEVASTTQEAPLTAQAETEGASELDAATTNEVENSEVSSNEATTEGSAEESSNEESSESNAINLASEPAIQLAEENKPVCTSNAYNGKITQKDLFKDLKAAFNGGDSTFYRISNDSGQSYEITRPLIGNGRDYELSGEYKVEYLIIYWDKGPKKKWDECGTLQVNRTQKVSFSCAGSPEGQGGVDNVTNVDSVGYAVDGSNVTFTVKSVDGYDVESVKVGENDVDVSEGTYSLTVDKADVTVVVTYKATDTATVSVVTGDSTVNLLDTTFTKDDNQKAVRAGVSGTLTVTPDEGYAVVSVTLDDKDVPLTFDSSHVATATVGAFEKDANVSLVVNTVKCGLVTKNDASSFEVGLVGSESSDYESLIYNAAIDTENSVPSGLAANNVKIQYFAGTTLLGDIWKDLGYQPESYEFWLHAFDASEGSSEKIRVTYAGSDQYAGSSVEFTVTSVENRLYTNTVTNDPVTIQYDANEDYMKASLYAQLDPKVFVQGQTTPVSGITADDFEISALEHKAGEQTVTVKFKGTKSSGSTTGLRPSETTVTVTVKKAPSSVSVTNKTETYDGKSKDVLSMVSSDPSTDETKPLVVIAGIDGDGKGYVSVDLGLVNADIQNVINEYLHLDKGVTVSGLSDLLNDETVVTVLKAALKGAGVEDADGLVESLQSVTSTMKKLGLGKSTISFGNAPSKAGAYLVTAVTTSGNYETSMGMGYLYISKKTEDVALSFTEELDSKISIDEAKSFNYGVGITGVAEGDSAKLLVTFAGTTSKAKPYLKTVTLNSNDPDLENKINAAAPSEPGAYTQTVITLGGNYRATPIMRAYNIERVDTYLTLEGFDLDRTTTYNGNEQPAKATVYDEYGNVVEGAYVTYLYSGASYNGKTYDNSLYAPSEAGEYAVKAVYLGDFTHNGATLTANFKIEAADVTFALEDMTTTYGESFDHKEVGYSVQCDEVENPLTEEQIDAILDTVTCEGNNNEHNATFEGGYVLSVSVPESVKANKNYNVTTTSAFHYVNQLELKMTVNDATKVFGEADPEFGCTLYDAEGREIADQDALVKELDVTLERDPDDNDELGEHAIIGGYANANYDIEITNGTLTIVPALTVTANGMGTTEASAKGGAAGTEIKVVATPVSDSYVFSGWVVAEGDAQIADANAAETTVTMGSENSTVVASFSAKPAPDNKKSDDGKKSDEKKLPSTGDMTNLAMPAGFAIVAVAMVAVAFVLKRRSK